MDDRELGELRVLAQNFRDALVRVRTDRASPALPYFPEGACRLVSRLLALHLTQRESGPQPRLRFVSGHVPGHDAFVRHTWLLVDDVIVDLTADPFGEAPVIVGPFTAFHDSLDALEEQEAEVVLANLSSDERNRLVRLLAPIEARLSTSR